MSRKNKSKGKGTPNSQATPSAPTLTSTPPQPQSLSATLKQHPVFLGISLLASVLVTAATVIPAAGYAKERWQETIATVDFSGDIDQSKPFSIPLVVTNPSQIFSMYNPKISCWVDVEYKSAGNVSKALMAADQGAIGVGLEVKPKETRNYLCNMPDNFTLRAAPPGTGPILPVKQADMLVAIDYETWVPWTVARRAVTKFVMFQTTVGFRWIKGDWVGSQMAIVWPPGSEPPWRDQKPK